LTDSSRNWSISCWKSLGSKSKNTSLLLLKFIIEESETIVSRVEFNTAASVVHRFIIVQWATIAFFFVLMIITDRNLTFQALSWIVWQIKVERKNAFGLNSLDLIAIIDQVNDKEQLDWNWKRFFLVDQFLVVFPSTIK
jgi:hypothetical protein